MRIEEGPKKEESGGKHLMMVEQLEGLWAVVSVFIKTSSLLQTLCKAFSMALCSNASAAPPPPLLWKRLSEPLLLVSKKARVPRNDENSAMESIAERSVATKAECMAVAAVEVGGRKVRKRPPMIVIPQSGGGAGEALFRKEEDVGREMEAEGKGYCLASRRGTRHMMEDGYGVITDIHGDSNLAFFGVYDGHGGRAAVDFVTEKLGKNIIKAMEEVNEEGERDRLETAIKAGYLTTDTEFLSQGVKSGVCAATVLLKKGELHVANVGDCRVVLSRNGVAYALTSDHRAGRQDEKIRIENSGGYVSCHNGVWRVQDTLAISRSIGDVSMKEWIISEPEIKRLQLTQDCEFLIMASDGLWDKVGNQEAVDVVMKSKNSMQSCKELVEISCNRGNRDDITVMVVDIQNLCS